MSYSRVHIFQTFDFVFASEHGNDYTLRETCYQLVHKSHRISVGFDDRFATKSPKHPQKNTICTEGTGTRLWCCVHLGTYCRGMETGIVHPVTAHF